MATATNSQDYEFPASESSYPVYVPTTENSQENFSSMPYILNSEVHRLETKSETVAANTDGKNETSAPYLKSFNKQNTYNNVIINKFIGHPTSKKEKTAYSLITQKWEGQIISVNGDVNGKGTFTAHLVRLDAESASIKLEFDSSEIAKNERHLISDNMCFYWIIGTESKRGGTPKNTECIIFRRMPNWKNFDVNEPSKVVDDFHKILSSKVEP